MEISYCRHCGREINPIGPYEDEWIDNAGFFSCQFDEQKHSPEEDYDES